MIFLMIFTLCRRRRAARIRRGLHARRQTRIGHFYILRFELALYHRFFEQRVERIQQRGQCGEHAYYGYERARAERYSHRRNERVGSEEADEKCGDGHDRARSHYRRECCRYGLLDRLAARHARFELTESVCKQYGVIDGRAHLYGTYYKISKEKQIVPHNHGQREVHEYRALDHKHQDRRYAPRPEREREYKIYKRDGQQRNKDIVVRERFVQVVSAHAFAREYRLRTYAANGRHYPFYQCERLLALDRRIDVEYYTVVFRSDELAFAELQRLLVRRYALARHAH